MGQVSSFRSCSMTCTSSSSHADMIHIVSLLVVKFQTCVRLGWMMRWMSLLRFASFIR